jgi:hypothetical protein
MPKILFQLPYVVRVADAPDFTTYDEGQARAALPEDDRKKPLRRIGVFIPALEGYGLPAYVDGQIETDNPAVIALLMNSGSGFKWDKVQAVAMLAVTPAEVIEAPPPVKVLPDPDLLTKDEIVEFAFDQGLSLDRRKSREALLKDLRSGLAKKGIKL